MNFYEHTFSMREQTNFASLKDIETKHEDDAVNLLKQRQTRKRMEKIFKKKTNEKLIKAKIQ